MRNIRLLVRPLFSLLYGLFLSILSAVDEHSARFLAKAIIPLLMLPFRSRRRENVLRFGGILKPGRDFVSFDRAHLGYMASLTVGFARMLRSDKDEIIENSRLEGEEFLRRALDGGNGALLVSSHFGNAWHSIIHLAVRGYPVSVLLNRTSISSLDRHILNIFSRFGVGVVPLNADATKNTRAILKRNAILLLFFDVTIPSKNCVHIPFGGATIRVHLGAGALALRSGAPVLTICNRVLPSGQSVTAIANQDDLQPDVELRNQSELILHSWVRALECEVMEIPEQWGSWGYIELGKAAGKTPFIAEKPPSLHHTVA